MSTSSFWPAFWGALPTIVSEFRWLDLLDIAIVYFVLYRLFLLIQGTRAVQLLRGLLLLAFAYIGVNFLQLNTITWLMQHAATMLIVAIPVVFQPELRRALAQLGQGRLLFTSEPTLTQGGDFFAFLDVLTTSAKQLSSNRHGALIVVERQTGLNEFIETGTGMEGIATAELLQTIFYPGSPLHDGAVIIRGNRIMAAGSVLPLAEHVRSTLVGRQQLGTRHRAAIGLSETSDALCLIVSEETGDISMAIGGKLYRHLSDEGLQKLLLDNLQGNAKPKGTSPLQPFLRGFSRRFE